MKKPSNWQQFKAFAFKGNMIDLALAVVLGGAFGGVVNSLAKNILMPLASYILPETTSYRDLKLGRIEVGTFLSELLNFLVIAVFLYLLVGKALMSIQKAVGVIDPSKPTTKECPYCLSNIPYKASKCAHCTADLPDADEGSNA